MEIITTEFGNRFLPSYVAFTDAEYLVGDVAKNQSSVNAENTVFDIMRLIGCEASVPKHAEFWPFSVVDGGCNKSLIQVTYKSEVKLFSPVEISSMLLAKLKEAAEIYLGSKVKSAVITIPIHFNTSQRQAIRDAARMADLNVKRLVHASSACAFTYDLSSTREKGESMVLVFDLGGGSLNVSLVDVEDGLIDVKAIAGDASLGGQEFTRRLMEDCVMHFERMFRKDLKNHKQAISRLFAACEKAKCDLSSAAQVCIEVDALLEGCDFRIEMTRSKFEVMNRRDFDKCIELVEKVLRDSRVTKSMVRDIVLVGGSTRIPKVQELLSDFFYGKELDMQLDADAAATYGAAVHAAILSGCGKLTNIEEFLLMDVTPSSLGVESAPGVMTTIIKRNTTTPAKKKATFTTLRDDQTAALIRVFEGERIMTNGNNFVCEFLFTGIPPMPRGVPQIEIVFDMNADAFLTVIAVETSTAKKYTIDANDYKSCVTVSESERSDLALVIYDAEAKAKQDRLDARSTLEKYTTDMRATMHNEALASNVPVQERKAVTMALEEAITWLNSNPEASKEEYDEKMNNLKDVVLPVLHWLRSAEQKTTDTTKTVSIQFIENYPFTLIDRCVGVCCLYEAFLDEPLKEVLEENWTIVLKYTK